MGSYNGGNEVSREKFESPESRDAFQARAGAEDAFYKELQQQQSPLAMDRSIAGSKDSMAEAGTEKSLSNSPEADLLRSLGRINSILHSRDPVSGTTLLERMQQNDPEQAMNLQQTINASPLAPMLSGEPRGGANFNAALKDNYTPQDITAFLGNFKPADA